MTSKIKQDVVNVVYEGLTEDYLFKWLNDNFDSKYSIYGINARGCDRIPTKCKQILRKNDEQNIIVLYDTDGTRTINHIMGLLEEYELKINRSDIYYIENEIETLLLFIKSKKIFKNDTEIKNNMSRYYGISNYHKNESQLKKIFSKLTKQEFIDAINNALVREFTNYNELFFRLYDIPRKRVKSRKTSKC